MSLASSVHPFTCLACGKGFKYEHSLNFHIKSYHGPTSSSNQESNVTNLSVKTSSSKCNNSSSKHNNNNSTTTASSYQHRSRDEDDDNDTKEWDENGNISDSGSNNSEKEKLENEKMLQVSRAQLEFANQLMAAGALTHSQQQPSPTIGHPGSSSSGTSTNSGHRTMSPNVNIDHHLGSPPSFLDKSIKIKSEKVLITILEGIHGSSDQSYHLFKCSLCGFAFPSLEPILIHVQSMHSSCLSNSNSSFTCDKCGASFKWRSELQLHDQLHKAMDSKLGSSNTNTTNNISSPLGSSSSSSHSGSHCVTNTAASSSSAAAAALALNPAASVLMPSFLSPNFMLLNPFGYEKLSPESFLLASKQNSSNNNNKQAMDSYESQKMSKSSSCSSSPAAANGQEKQRLFDSGQALNLSLETGNSVKLQQQCNSNASSTASSAAATLKHLRVNSSHKTCATSSGNGQSHAIHSSSQMNSDRTLSLVLNDELTKQLMQHNEANPIAGSAIGIGEIEETAPGQFKCRYCDKTFDRIFSVHRHERVHTGYKPCICKVCGRGFSEKRNLRHHIIRFHSDGSGRELLKRARKDKTLAATTKQLAASVVLHKGNSNNNIINNLGDISTLNHKSVIIGQNHQMTNCGSNNRSSGNLNEYNCNNVISSRNKDNGSVDLRSHHNLQRSQNQKMTSNNNFEDTSDQEENQDDNLDNTNSNESSPKQNGMRTIQDDICSPASSSSQQQLASCPSSRSVNHASHGSKRSGREMEDDEEEREEEENDDNERITASPPSSFSNRDAQAKSYFATSSSITSSSRRRKGKPSKKIVLAHDEDDDEEERRIMADEDGEDGDQKMMRIKKEAEDEDAEFDQNDEVGSESGNLRVAEEENQPEDDPEGIVIKGQGSDDECNMSGSDCSNGGNNSENSLEGMNASGKVRNHGAFFSSYSPRLGIVEKPIKRNEACRPLLGPDGKYLYPCGYCQKTFCSLSDLNRHMNFHEDVRPFKCQHCDYQSRTNSQLKVHMMRHAGIKQYLCQTCNYNGVTQSDLNRHCKTRSHVLRSSNVCPLCSLGFSTSTLLEEHLVKFHDSESSNQPHSPIASLKETVALNNIPPAQASSA